MTMNPEIKAEWLKRLRDGRPQTQRMLQQIDRVTGETVGQCCLGVLCEIAVERGILRTIEDAGYKDRVTFGPVEADPDNPFMQASTTVLPEIVVDWARLPDDNPTVRYTDPQDSYEIEASLAEMNDDRNADFTTIADAIERNF